MNAGKSTMLLQANHNYSERGMNAQLYTSSLDNRFGNDEITSRIGLKKKNQIYSQRIQTFLKKSHLNIRLYLLIVYLLMKLSF